MLAITEETWEQTTDTRRRLTDRWGQGKARAEYLMRKGRLIAIQDTGIVQHHPLSDQRDDAVPKPGDHLSVSERDRLPADAKGK